MEKMNTAERAPNDQNENLMNDWEKNTILGTCCHHHFSSLDHILIGLIFVTALYQYAWIIGKNY